MEEKIIQLSVRLTKMIHLTVFFYVLKLELVLVPDILIHTSIWFTYPVIHLSLFYSNCWHTGTYQCFSICSYSTYRISQHNDIEVWWIKTRRTIFLLHVTSTLYVLYTNRYGNMTMYNPQVSMPEKWFSYFFNLLPATWQKLRLRNCRVFLLPLLQCKWV